MNVHIHTRKHFYLQFSYLSNLSNNDAFIFKYDEKKMTTQKTQKTKINSIISSTYHAKYNNNNKNNISMQIQMEYLTKNDDNHFCCLFHSGKDFVFLVSQTTKKKYSK